MPKRFRFTLEAVLKVRRTREQKSQLEYAVLREQRLRELAKLGRMEQRRHELNAEQAASRGKRLHAPSLSIFEDSRTALGERIVAQRKQLTDTEKELEVKRLELVAASRDRKVLEQLETTQYQAYLEKLNKEEQTFLDELARYSGQASANAVGL